MMKLEVFDPPICCPTGICGPRVDPALVQFAADMHWLGGQGIATGRFNLAQQPQTFVANPAVKAALNRSGRACLPLILVNGVVVSEGRYPSRRELAALAGVDCVEPVSLPVLPGA